MKTFALFLSLIILSCNTQKETTQKDGAKNETTMKQETLIDILANESHGGYETSKYLIIKDQESLEEIYGKVNMMRRPGLPIPEIDWKNEMVIALFMGQKNSGGYSIVVDKITSINDNEIEFLLKETKPEGITTAVICQPFYFCKVQRTDKDVVFKKVE